MELFLVWSVSWYCDMKIGSLTSVKPDTANIKQCHKVLPAWWPSSWRHSDNAPYDTIRWDDGNRIPLAIDWDCPVVPVVKSAQHDVYIQVIHQPYVLYVPWAQEWRASGWYLRAIYIKRHSRLSRHQIAPVAPSAGSPPLSYVPSYYFIRPLIQIPHHRWLWKTRLIVAGLQLRTLLLHKRDGATNCAKLAHYYSVVARLTVLG